MMTPEDYQPVWVLPTSSTYHLASFCNGIELLGGGRPSQGELRRAELWLAERAGYRPCETCQPRPAAEEVQP